MSYRVNEAHLSDRLSRARADAWGLVTTDIFGPLFEVTKDPKSHPELHVFLQRVIGLDSVDDESKVERRLYRSELSRSRMSANEPQRLSIAGGRVCTEYPFPKDWDTKQNPPYNYWLL